jgi:HSP20 family protein
MGRKDLTPQKEGRKDPAERRGDPFSTFREEMDKLMDNIFGGFDLRRFERRIDTFVPRMDVVDTGKEIKVSAELPGLDEKDIDVSFANETLTIRGEKKEDKEEKGKDYYRSERSYGSFTRTIPVPADIDPGKVAATFRKGVLTVTMPKTKQAIDESKKISIKSE